MESLEKKVYIFVGEDYSEKSELSRSLEDNQSEDSIDQLQHDPARRSLYWESRNTLLQEILERYILTGSKLREATGEMIEVAKGSHFCKCSNINSFGCPCCLRKRAVAVLTDSGYNATLCISKWEHTKKFPGGSHEYIQVMTNTQKTKKQISVLIELELRDQFQIARASEEYKKLVSMLPEFYVGRPEYLNGIIRVMCDAAKRSMKEKKIHMGPWRKSSFMQMKWSGLSKNNPTLDDEPLSASLPTFPLGQAREPSCLGISGAPPVIVT